MDFLVDLTNDVKYNLRPHIDPVFNLNVGNVQRFDTKKKNDKAGWIIINEWDYKGNTNYCAVYGSFKDGGFTHKYTSTKITDKKMNKASVDAIKKLSERAEQEKKDKYTACKTKWEPIYDQLPESGPTHKYLIDKQVESNHRARVDSNDVLYIPVYNADGFTGSQRIFFNLETKSFEKKYTFGLELSGSFCPFGSFKDIGESDFIYLVEGYATGATVYELTGVPTVACLQAGNIIPAIKTIRDIFPGKRICIAGDNDDSKTGEIKSKAACKEFKDVIYKLPKFEHKAPGLSDYNDLLMVSDKDTVKSQLQIFDSANFDLERFVIDVEQRFVQINEETGKKYKDLDRLVEFFYAKYKYVRMTDLKQTMVSDGRIYKFMNDEEIGNFALTYLVNATMKDIDEFRNKAKLGYQARYHDFTSQMDGYINFKNGIYDLKQRKLIPHDHKFKFQYYVPVDFDPKAICPTWDKLLENVTLDRPELQNILNEYFGYALSNMSYGKFQKALIMDGAGSNGKTTIINAVRMVLGEKNSSDVSMSEMNKNRFLSFDLVNRLMNVSEEEDKAVFNSTGMFKRLTGNSPIHVEQKGKQGWSFCSRAKVVMTYNEMPFLGDLSEGMLRRLMIIPFEMNTKMQPDRKIENVLGLIENEVSGIANRWIQHLHLLLDRGEFTQSHLVHNKINELRVSSDSVLDFFNEYMEFADEYENGTNVNSMYFIPFGILFDKYKEDSGTSNRTGPRKFSKKIKEHFGLETTQRRWAQSSALVKSNCRGYFGVRFKANSMYEEFNGSAE